MKQIKDMEVIAHMKSGKTVTLYIYKSGDNHFVSFDDLPEQVEFIEFGLLDTEPYKEQVWSLRKRANHFEKAYIDLYEKYSELVG